MTPRSHLSAETLDLLHLGALAPDERAGAELHLGACGACRERHERLAADAAHFHQYVLPRTLPRVEERARRTAPTRSRWGLALSGLVLAGALGALVLLVTPPRSGEEPGYVATRGDASLRLVALRGEQQVQVGPETVLREGDRLRFLVDAGGGRHALVVSRDGAGQWTVYAPFGAQRSAPVAAGLQALPGSIELDATAGVEHVIAVISDAPLASADVLRALASTPWPPRGPVRVPGARAVVVTSFRKQ